MGMHTEVVKKNLISGVWLFIVSEAGECDYHGDGRAEMGYSGVGPASMGAIMKLPCLIDQSIKGRKGRRRGGKLLTPH